ncbi:MAG: glutaredoxin family protein [Fuerstiella sp.]|nr:glutaredoxin family protein [Fuerstiella sp.]
MIESQIENRLTAAIGTACWVFAGVFSTLVFADRWTSLGLRFPDLWYASRNFHVLMCVGLYVAGWLALRNSGESEQNDTAAPMFDSLTLYTRRDCELCDKALDILRHFGDQLPTIRIVDIDHDPELLSRHRDWIPVVEIDGRVYFRGIVNPVLLERMIRAQQDRQQTEALTPHAPEQVEE